MPSRRFRIERDSLGSVRVPHEALYGAQTQRAVENFPISGWRFPRGFLRALGLIKASAAAANRRLRQLDARTARAIESSALAVASGRHDDQFPLDVFQTGSGTSTNMNANEVIATLASRRLRRHVHPNDHVNSSQSSNDVIPTAIHVSAVLELTERLLPALRHLQRTIDRKAHAVRRVVKTGRTHLMDAVPIQMSQELGGWSAQVGQGIERIESSLPRLRELAIGGTAVGTGLNAPRGFGRLVAQELSRRTRQRFVISRNAFMSLSSQDATVEMSGQLRALAVSLLKIANDLRWMNSGPQAGLGEITLPALQPGSSIMPGKVNPVIPEAVAMVCAQVIGCDATVAIAGSSGNFQLNVMLPVIAANLLESIALLASASRLLADRAITGFRVNDARVAEVLARNPILATALNPLIGYERAAAVVKRAIADNRPILDVAAEMTSLPRARLARLLHSHRLTRGGLARSPQ